MMVLALPNSGPADQHGDFTYKSNGTNVTITGYTGSGGAVVIPDTIESLPVTTIGQEAFRNCYALANVTIPDSVITIEDQAFHNCDALTTVTIPDSVTDIGHMAFYTCSSLNSVTIGNSGGLGTSFVRS